MRHLPRSSQLEYRRLIERMQLLEKQREQRSQRNISATNGNKSSNSNNMETILPNITITVSEDNRIVQTNVSSKIEKTVDVNVEETAIASTTANAGVSTTATATITANATETNKQPENATGTAMTVQSSMKSIPTKQDITFNAVSSENTIVSAKASESGTIAPRVLTNPNTASTSSTGATKKIKNKAAVLNAYVVKYNTQR